MSQSKAKCFVIMPFSGTTIRHTAEYWTEFYEDFLKPLIEEDNAIDAHRSEALRGDILNQIIADLISSEIVVADLTDANPNVYWELGVRQSFAHRTITILESDQELPFDLGIKGTLRYSPKQSASMKKFESRFRAAIKDCLDNPKRPDSHVIQAISGRGTIYEVIHHEETDRRLGAVLTELARNEQVLSLITKSARYNEKTPDSKKWHFVTSRFKLPSLELLVTNRYLETTEGFYATAEVTYNQILAWDEQLPIWQLRPERTQRWIIRQLNRKQSSLMKAIPEFREEVAKERQALRNRL
ncbi:MAG: hypothetical protein ABSF82_03350 [Candidatus Bathyarchaeia archaeon]